MLKLRQHKQIHNSTTYIYFLLLSFYMFRHYRHIQGAYTKISLKHKTIAVWCCFNEILVWACWR